MRGGICTSGATRFRGRATTLLAANTVFPTVTLFPYWGTPSPYGFSKLQPFSVGAGPSGKRRNTPHQKEKGNQAEALRSRGELLVHFSFKLDSVSVKQHTLTGTRRPKLSAVVCATLDGLLQPVKKIKGQSSRSSA